MEENYYKRSVFKEVLRRQQGFDNKRSLQKSTKNSLALTQSLKLETEINVHKGCVNSLVWNSFGDKILSASDDQKLVVSNPFTSEIYLKYTTVHRSNIFSAKFLPQSESKVVSCAGNGSVLYTDLSEVPMSVEPGGASSTMVGGSYRASNENLSFFSCHNGKTAYEVITIPTEPSSFMSCGEDGTVRFFDLRTVSRCTLEQCRENILVYLPIAVTSISLSPLSNTFLAVGSADFVRIFDRRYMKLVELPNLESSNSDSPVNLGPHHGAPYHSKALKYFKIPTEDKRTYRVTSLVFSPDEKELLASFSSDYLYLFDVTQDGVTAEGTNLEKGRKKRRESPKVLRKLRLRGDWSDTGPEARPLSEVSAQSRPQLNSGLMNRMTGLLSRMLNDPRQRQSNRTDENVAEGISMLFGNNEHEIEASVQEEPSTSTAASNSSTESEEAQRIVDSSSSSSEDDNTNNQLNYSYVTKKFMGHRNCRTMIKESNFWGDDYILSGSDCGHVFIWNRKSGELVNLLQADRHVVNCVQPHQTLPVLATSGIDYSVKIWMPTGEDVFDEKQASDIMQRNRLMLEETRDIVTVPASMIIRMLACLHSYNRNNNSADNQEDASSS